MSESGPAVPAARLPWTATSPPMWRVPSRAVVMARANCSAVSPWGGAGWAPPASAGWPRVL